MKTYKSIRPFILQIKNSNLQFGKNQVFVVNDNKVYIQGRKTPISMSTFSKILEMDVLIETNCSDDFIKQNVILDSEYIKVQKVISKANKELYQYKQQLKTISTWAFRPKGSSASKIEQEIEFQNNREEILKHTILREGMKAKPGDVHMNRGTERHGPFVSEEESKMWLSDDTTILPYGIRKSDYATQSEQVKIFKKLIQQVCSMEDCPKDFKEFFKSELNVIPDDEPFKDYLPLIDKHSRQDLGYPKLLFSDFSKNQHHSKEKGLEFCHLDPWMSFPTNVDNVTIGSSRANRQQGGFPLWYMKDTFKQC